MGTTRVVGFAAITFALLFVFLITCDAARPAWHQLEGYTFERYLNDFGKAYSSASEKEFRKALFEQRLKEIKVHNADKTKTWKEGVNHMTDWTEAEFKRLLGYKKSIAATMPKSPLATEWNHPAVRLEDLPQEVDWRDKGVVTPVKDQGRCGSCWTFATAETIESHWAIKTGQLPILSEQQILDCTPNPDQCGGTGGCAGGTAELAMARIVQMGGLSSEWTYPYMSYYGANASCHFTAQTPPAAHIAGYQRLPTNVQLPLMQAVAELGPIAISVDASSWQKYEQGVFDGCNQTHPDIDHAVQLVGYGTDPVDGDYWLVRNSWSPAWGDKGYIKLKRSISITCGVDLHPQDGTGCKDGPPTVVVCGTCGILYDNTFPIMNK